MIITLKTAKQTALTFFIIGTILFLIQWVAENKLAIAFLIAMFLLIAAIYNFIVCIILLFQLIKYNDLDSFFSLVLILLNIPVAVGYAYILIHF